MDVIVAGWIGSTNLGDELVFAGLRRLCAEVGLDPVALSIDPAATERVHGVDALPPLSTAAWRRAADAAGVVFGGGGLVQDETSPFNLPYHLARVATTAEARGRPWVGLGLGVGPLGGTGRRLARALGRAAAISVRDAPSARLLASAGVPGAVVAADLAFHLPPVDTPPDDVVVVCLRPWTGSRSGFLPVGWRRDQRAIPDWFVATVAAQLDELATATGLEVRFVALQPDRDHAVHLDVAARMTTSATCVRPDLDDVVAEVARGRLVVSMRYHGAVVAVLAGRPVATIGYSPKVDALAADLGGGAAGVAWSRDGVAGLAAAAAAVTGRGDDVVAGRERLVERAAGNREVLERLLASR